MGLNCVMQERLDNSQIVFRKDETRVVDAAKIPLSLVQDASKFICQISFTVDNKAHRGTGFFIEIDKHKCLFTNCHNIPEDYKNIDIIVKLYKSKKIKIRLSNQYFRYYRFIDYLDIAIIEIKDSDYIINDIIFLDYDSNYIKGYDKYVNIDLFALQYPNDEIEVASGKIKEILNDFEFKHNINTEIGSSGSPIIILSKSFCKVIGIHKQGGKKINFGSFIGEIFKDKYLFNKEINDNYIIGEINISKNDIGKNIRINNSYEN